MDRYEKAAYRYVGRRLRSIIFDPDNAPTENILNEKEGEIVAQYVERITTTLADQCQRKSQ